MASMHPDSSLPQESQSTSRSQEELTTAPSLEEDVAPTTVEEPPVVPTPEASLPPEAQGEANGGPLGCCLGTVVGLLLTFLLITGTSILLTNGGFLGFATFPGALAGACVGGYFGWKIGKRVYKEYDPPIVKRRGRTNKKAKPKPKKA